MKLTSAIIIINVLVFGVAPHGAGSINLRAILNKRRATYEDHASTNDEDASAPTIDGGKLRELQSVDCWGDKPSAAWHPVYSVGWTGGYCRYTVDCNSPPYSSELTCCKAAYAGQVSGACLRQLPSPPTSSPTGKGGGLGVYYPDYNTPWPEAKCIDDAPMPSGRPTYSTMLACCKGAYGGQVSGMCLASLPSPPTTSPTLAGGLADFWYPDYDTPWAGAGCLNILPLPYNNVKDRPNYPTQLACCKGAYGGQMSGICLLQLPSPPSTSPTLSGGRVDFWYPNYESPWDKTGCLDSLPLPYGPGDRPEYTSRVACCRTAYGSQTSNQCMCEAVGVCFACSCGTAKERCENNCSNLDCQDDHEDGCATLLANQPTSAATNPQATTTTTAAATTTQAPCFPNEPLTLSAAVKAYVDDDCANDSNCAIGQEWGHPINSWCVEQVTSFRNLFLDFSGSLATFNEDINGWTTSQVTNMNYVFWQAKAFNQPLDNWDVSLVTDMGAAFILASAFNQPLNNWDVSSVTTMYGMFKEAIAFNQPLNNWNVSSVTDMGGVDNSGMFQEASAFNQPLNNWDVSSVTNMPGVFREASAFNQPLNNWNVSLVTAFYSMFHDASAFNQPLNNWNVSPSVSRMRSMFDGASAFNQDLCHFGDHYNGGIDYSNMFSESGCPNTVDPTSANGPWCQTC